MKVRRHRSEIETGSRSHRQSDTHREIRNFLRALNSYPKRFADNPYVSFEQHLFSIALTSSLSGETSRHN